MRKEIRVRRGWRLVCLSAGLGLCLQLAAASATATENAVALRNIAGQPQAAGAEAAEAEARALLKQADGLFSNGDFAAALQLMAQAVELASSGVGPLAQITLQARIDHGSTLYHMGRLAEARLELEAVVIDLQRELGDRHELTLDALNNYANLLSDLEGPRAALVIQRRALAGRLELQGAEHENSINALNDVAVGMMFAGELHAALPLALEVLALRQKTQGETHPWTFTAYNNLGFLYGLLGRSEEARRLHEHALGLRMTHRGEKHPETLVSMNNLAQALSDLGEQDAALALLDRTIALMDELGLEHPSALDARQNRAVIWLEQSRWGEAQAELIEVIALRLRVQSAEHPKRLAALISLAQVRSGLALFDAALGDLDDVQGRVLLTLGDHHPLYFKAQHSRGLTLLRAERPAAALACLEQAQRRAAATFGEDFDLALSLRGDWARALLALGQAEAAELLLKDALTRLDRLRTALPLQDAEARQRWQSRHAKHYRLLMQARLALGDHDGALSAFQQSRARSLSEMLDDRAAALAAGVSAAEWQALQEAREQVGGLAALLTRESRAGERSSLLEARAGAIKVAQGLHASLVQQHPNYGAISAPTLAAATLPNPAAGEAWIAYATLEPLMGTAGPNLAAFVRLQGQATHCLPLGQVEGLADEVQALQLWAANSGQRHPLDSQGRKLSIVHWKGQDGRPRWRVALATAAHAPAAKAVWGAPALAQLTAALSQKLLLPLQAWLKPTQHWAISADQTLLTLPWDVLPWQGQPLGASVALTLPTTATQAKSPQAPKANPPGLSLWAIGDPSFDLPEAAGGGSRGLGGRRGLRMLDLPRNSLDADGHLTLDAQLWERLPAASSEMHLSAKAFKNAGGQTRLLQGQHATESGLRRANASGELASARVLLFSTHAFFNPRQPLLSAVVLKREGELAANDGYLTPAEFVGLRLNADLTVLSACSTAQGATEPGDAAAGFAYALRLAGSRQSLLTLWPVHDQVTATFIAKFMARIASGQSAAAALQATKREFITHPRPAWRQPQHWAGFVLYGSARTEPAGKT